MGWERVGTTFLHLLFSTIPLGRKRTNLSRLQCRLSGFTAYLLEILKYRCSDSGGLNSALSEVDPFSEHVWHTFSRDVAHLNVSEWY